MFKQFRGYRFIYFQLKQPQVLNYTVFVFWSQEAPLPNALPVFSAD